MAGRLGAALGVAVGLGVGVADAVGMGARTVALLEVPVPANAHPASKINVSNSRARIDGERPQRRCQGPHWALASLTNAVAFKLGDDESLRRT